MNFFDWLMEVKRVFPVKERPKKRKIASVAHTDIDRWLKSVDGLAKDLEALKSVKDKVKGKMDQISKSNSSSKTISDDEKQKSDQELKFDKNKKNDQEPIKQPDIEDNSDVKRTRQPISRNAKNKDKDFDLEKNVE
jgi:hypothetical protein